MEVFATNILGGRIHDIQCVIMGADIEKIIKNDSLLPGSLAVGAIWGGYRQCGGQRES